MVGSDRPRAACRNTSYEIATARVDGGEGMILGDATVDHKESESVHEHSSRRETSAKQGIRKPNIRTYVETRGVLSNLIMQPLFPPLSLNVICHPHPSFSMHRRKDTFANAGRTSPQHSNLNDDSHWADGFGLSRRQVSTHPYDNEQVLTLFPSVPCHTRHSYQRANPLKGCSNGARFAIGEVNHNGLVQHG
jgi:hypothetical protein